MSSVLEARIRRAVRDEGLRDLTLHLTQTGAWQCVVLYAGSSRRGLCVRGNETDAVLGALDDAFRVAPPDYLRAVPDPEAEAARETEDKGVFG